MLNPGLWQSSKYGGLHVALCWAKDAALIQWTQWGNSDHHRGGDASRPWEEADGLEGWINLGPRRKREENRQILPCPWLLLFPSRLLVSAQQIAPSHLRPLSREALPTEAHRAGALGPPASRQRRWPGYIIKHCYPVCYSGVWEQKHCCKGFSLVAVSGPLSSCGAGASHRGGPVVAHRLSCFEACRIFLDQESKASLLHWQADGSLPLSHHGSPSF